MKDPVRFLIEHFPPTPDEVWETTLHKDLRGANYKDVLRWSSPEGFDVLPFYRRSTDGDLATSAAASSSHHRQHSPVFAAEAFPNDPFADFFETSCDIPDGEKSQQQSTTNATADALFTSDGPIDIDATRYHEAGATLVQELAAALATVNEYMVRAVRASEASRSGHSLSAGDLSGRFVTYLSAGSLYFPEIAKFRAWRILVDGLMCLYEAKTQPAPTMIHAVTSCRNKSLQDTHDNLIRLTTEAMAAVTGGADRLTIRAPGACGRAVNVAPGSNAINPKKDAQDSFQRRMAHNIYHLLTLEAHLDKVANPADGCYYLDELTHQLAENAWELFRRMEQEGGFQEALVSGRFAGEVEKARRERMQNLKEGRT